MLTRTFLFCILPLLLIANGAFAHGDSAEITQLRQRLEALEQSRTRPEASPPPLAERLAERLSLSGLIEVEAAAERLRFAGGNQDSASDLLLATAQLGVGIAVHEGLRGDLVFLFEEDPETEDRIEVDEAAIQFDSGPWSVRVGRQYLPFGTFASQLISDPLTLELGETRATALVAGYGSDFWRVSAFAFNGRADREDGENHVDDFGFSLGLTPSENLELGASYLSDLADSDAELRDDYRQRVAGWSAYALGTVGPLELSGEVLGALRHFAATDLDADGNGRGDRPLAWNLEVATGLTETVQLALRLEGSRELAEQPELQYGLGCRWQFHEQVSLALEYLRGEFDPDFATVDGADRPLDHRDLLTAQLALSF